MTVWKAPGLANPTLSQAKRELGRGRTDFLMYLSSHLHSPHSQSLCLGLPAALSEVPSFMINVFWSHTKTAKVLFQHKQWTHKVVKCNKSYSLPARHPRRARWGEDRAGGSQRQGGRGGSSERIWVAHHFDAPAPWAGGLLQAEEDNWGQVWVGNIRIRRGGDFFILTQLQGGRWLLWRCLLLRDAQIHRLQWADGRSVRGVWACRPGGGRLGDVLCHASHKQEPLERKREREIKSHKESAAKAQHIWALLASPEQGRAAGLMALTNDKPLGAEAVLSSFLPVTSPPRLLWLLLSITI